MGRAAEEEVVPSRERYPYVLVMERGERSLFHVLASERIAGAALLLWGAMLPLDTNVPLLWYPSERTCQSGTTL